MERQWATRRLLGQGGVGRAGRGPGVERKGLEPAGLLPGFGLLWVGFSPMFFSISNKTNLGEIKFKFEFTTSTQTRKAMHQHECINKVLTLDKILIT